MTLKYLTIDDTIDKHRSHPPEDRRLSLAYEELIEIPCSLAERFGWWVQILDLSYNKLRDLTFLACFDRLNTVILDHNEISSTTLFPPTPSLRTLWLNYNNISNLILFLPTLTQRCPNLENLSLMGNVGVPSFLNGSTTEQKYHYRVYVASLLPKLNFLDDRSVGAGEREDACRLDDILNNILKVLRRIKSPDNQTHIHQRSSYII